VSGLLRRIPVALGILAIAAGLGLGLVWLKAPRGVAIAPGAPAPEAVLVAARPVPPGALLRDEDLSWRPLSGGPAPAGAFLQAATAKETLVGAAAVRGLTPGEVLRADGVVKPDQRNFLAATLGPGLRAVTISVDAPQSASGLVLPGDRVDVILVQEVGDGARRMAAETVLRNSRVLAVGRSLAPEKSLTGEARDAAGGSPRTITLETTPYNAERLYLASRLGELQLSLRGPGDIADEDGGAPVWAGDVSDAARLRTAPVKPTDRPIAPSSPREALQTARDQVLILRGGAGSPS
jgi:pilus assembly protein CpaB